MNNYQKVVNLNQILNIVYKQNKRNTIQMQMKLKKKFLFYKKKKREIGI